MRARGMKDWGWITLVLVLVVFSCWSMGQDLNSPSDLSMDECLNISVAINLTRNFAQSLQPSPNVTNFAIQEPTTAVGITNLYRKLYDTIIQSSSPWSLNVGIGFPSDAFFAIQSCRDYTYPCNSVNDDFFAYLVSPAYYNDVKLRFVRIGNFRGDFYFNISDIATVSDDFRVSTRPWFAAYNTWSVPYKFAVGGAQSRSYVSQPSPSTGCRIFADRSPDEPCTTCLARSPCIALANFAANDVPYQSWLAIKNVTNIQAVFKWIYLRYSVPWQIQNTILSVGLGFGNNDFYSVTDCGASPIKGSLPECQGGLGYYAEVRNTAVFGDDHIHVFNFTTVNGDTSSTSRDSGQSYGTTNTTWYIRGQGWTDRHSFAGAETLVTRSYVRWFYGGVIITSINPTNVCPQARFEQGSTGGSGRGRSSFLMDLVSLVL
eukprot:TRINITY_DN2264_c0_g1_i1.p1 TRINITY_DN2264_c0_g1~~TRINITY_DN2264_c0_g1_i1.p1  ORF type:complete len:431 (+),score=42.75 TRINITY_DN2264_c0_g1_i1:43-1335(+)